MQRTDFLQLRYGSGKVIEPFLSRIFGESGLKCVYLISPWITHMGFKTANTQKLIQKIKSEGVRLVLITRPPDPGTKHEEFVNDVLGLPSASIFYLPILHAKFYVISTKQRRYALISSANMYEWSSNSYEIGVTIEARGEGELLVDKLEELAIELRVNKQIIRV